MVDSLMFFFFQAEDGIRDIGVTGVQTCALPISDGRCHRADRAAANLRADRRLGAYRADPASAGSGLRRRRRVGRGGAHRKSVVYGESVDLGGRRLIKKKKKHLYSSGDDQSVSHS